MKSDKKIRGKVEHIVGRTVSSTTFGLDNWHIDFDGHTFAVWNRIEITGPGGVVGSPDDGFRDRLCERTGRILRAVEWNADGVSLSFEDDVTVFLSTRAQDYRGPEAVMFTNTRQQQIIVV